MVVLSLTGCGEKAEEKIVRLMMWDIVAARPTVDKAVVRWEKAHRGYTIRVEKIPPSQYEEKLIILLGAKDAPDVIIVPQSRYAEYVRQTALLNLTDKLKRSDSIRGLMGSKELDNLYMGGRIRGIPMGIKGLLWAIPASSKHPHLAWDLLSELTVIGYGDLKKSKLDYSNKF